MLGATTRFPPKALRLTSVSTVFGVLPARLPIRSDWRSEATGGYRRCVQSIFHRTSQGMSVRSAEWRDG
jgi:hypothetical protein